MSSQMSFRSWTAAGPVGPDAHPPPPPSFDPAEFPTSSRQAVVGTRRMSKSMSQMFRTMQFVRHIASLYLFRLLLCRETQDGECQA